MVNQFQGILQLIHEVERPWFFIQSHIRCKTNVAILFQDKCVCAVINWKEDGAGLCVLAVGGIAVAVRFENEGVFD